MPYLNNCNQMEREGLLKPAKHAGKQSNGYSSQAASIEPMFGQKAYFEIYAPEKIRYAIDRYTYVV